MKPSQHERLPVATRRSGLRPAARPAHHAIDDEERRRVKHPQRQQRDRHRRDATRRRASTRIALNENPSTPKTEHNGPIQRPPLAGQSHLHDAGPGRDEDHGAEGDPVPGERNEVVMRDVTDQPAHAGERRDERGREAHAERRQRLRRQQRCVLAQRVAASPRTASESRGRTRTRSLPRARARTACRR